MKQVIPLLALIVSACAAGSDADPITPVSNDSCALARPDLGGPASQADLALFAYDANAPLNLQSTVESAAAGIEVSGISYDSPAGGRVTGIMARPINRPTPRPGIILMHGSPGEARDFLGYAQTLANYGAVVIAIDAPFARRGGSPLRMTKQDREEQIQLMKDLQRAVDVLRADPAVDNNRIAYLGVSFGGATGVLFAGIEHRIKAVALVVADAGMVTHSTNAGALPFMASLSCATRVAWFREMVPIEAIRFIGFATPTPLLLQNGTSDPLIPKEDAELLHAAAPEPKTVQWYNAGHGLTQQATYDRHNWLVAQIGLDPL